MPHIQKPNLDHIVILVSSQILANLPSWLGDNLTVLPGGHHADGLTENKLIVFEDGVYIELIAFVSNADPEQRAKHRWGQQAEGTIVDWALTLLPTDNDARSPEEHFAAVQARVHDARAGYSYADPVPGGRINPAGEELRWAISASRADAGSDAPALGGGELPFWCLDRTPRRLRVPLTGQPDNATHPSGAVGLGAVSITVSGLDKADRLRRVYDAIYDETAEELATDPSIAAGYRWKVPAPVPLETAEARLTVRAWAEHVDVRQLRFEETHTRISLFTKGSAGWIGGDIGLDHKLVIELIPLGSTE